MLLEQNALSSTFCLEVMKIYRTEYHTYFLHYQNDSSRPLCIDTSLSYVWCSAIISDNMRIVYATTSASLSGRNTTFVIEQEDREASLEVER